MVQITLPDGSRREFPRALTVAELPRPSAPAWPRSRWAGKVDGQVS